MSKHTVFVEAPPFAKFSDAEMRRLLDDERLEVLDWRGKRVNTPGFVEALATADIAVTGNSLTITDELLEKLPNLKLIAKLGTGLDMIDIPAVLRRGILLCNTPGAIIDAYSQEPLTASPLFSLDNVILSPHAGAFTTDALNAMSRMSVDQLFQYVDGATPDNLVTAE